jgi:hypothetical protein
MKDKVYEDLKKVMADKLIPRSGAVYLQGFQKEERRLVREKKLEKSYIEGEVFYKIIKTN